MAKDKPLTFRTGTLDDVQLARATGSMPSKYGALIDAVCKLRPKQTIILDSPADRPLDLFRGAIKQALARYVPEPTRSKYRFEVRKTADDKVVIICMKA